MFYLYCLDGVCYTKILPQSNNFINKLGYIVQGHLDGVEQGDHQGSEVIYVFNFVGVFETVLLRLSFLEYDHQGSLHFIIAQEYLVYLALNLLYEVGKLYLFVQIELIVLSNLLLLVLILLEHFGLEEDVEALVVHSRVLQQSEQVFEDVLYHFLPVHEGYVKILKLDKELGEIFFL